ncbi:MAG: peptidoglycan DD-metalloendopeptidase family protein [bacterium]|nr:peptidoglycan DD-metalloendopeptidase family protein [bacterium]
MNSVFSIKPAQSQAVFGGPDSDILETISSESDQIAFAASDSPEILSDDHGQDEGLGFFILDEALVYDTASPFFGIVSKNRDQTITYRVVEGDTLSTIAEKFGLKVGTLLGANKGLNANLQIGKEMIILPGDGVLHTVVKGNTLSGIASMYDVQAQKIIDFNQPGETLAIGEKLFIPGGKIAQISGGSSAGYSSLPSFPGYFAIPTKGVITQRLHGHNGVDFGNARGSAVYASAAGTVIRVNVGTYNGGYGNLVVISHDNGTQTWYAHLDSVLVSVGQAVSQNEDIGRVGNSGRSTGPHLHFEVRNGKNPFGVR